ncbi:MAG: NADH-quinone oxidoreductase subunit A [Planctomycetaceae bacterium]|nr:NADH-quinone oxidoreductase subunit A [Planctomycetaceae bacterium]
MQNVFVPIFLLVICTVGLAIALLIGSRLFHRRRVGQVTRMPYESGMDPIHDTRRRFDVRFHLLAVAFLVFDVELLFLYPWAVVAGDGARLGRAVEGVERTNEAASVVPTHDLRAHPSSEYAFPRVSHSYFFAAMTFLLLLAVGYVYLWRKGVFRWE